MQQKHASSGCTAEDLFVELFTDTFGEENAEYLYPQYHFYDIYQNSRHVDFILENGIQRVAIEIDSSGSHESQPNIFRDYCDDILKQNSMIHFGWDVYRWTEEQLQRAPDLIRDELRMFLGSYPRFRQIEDYLPPQKARVIDGSNLELREHQKAALKSLEEMRANGETIALLYHATGTGKTTTAVMDAKRCGGRVLFIAHTQELVDQAAKRFQELWPGVSVGRYCEGIKQPWTHVICGSVQSVALYLDQFNENDFSYLIVDEAHHATADTYKKILSYFRPAFTLGLTATPERADNKSILDVFCNTAHKLDIQTAVEIGVLAPVRCFRIPTNVDLSKVRFNRVRYNVRDLEEKIYVMERNKLIVDTWMKYARDKRTVVFCASVKHAKQIAELFLKQGVSAAAVSGDMKKAQRMEFQERFVNREIMVLCACDLLNEGWDCPEIEVLFMARPTMSKVLYTQQLGRGMRLHEGKDSLVVFDFVDNANQYNIPYSLHRLFQIKDYQPGKLVVAPCEMREAEEALLKQGKTPEALLDWTADADTREEIDIFSWQEESSKMISLKDFIRRVDVQAETIKRYVREGKLIPDMTVPMGEHNTGRYFSEETLEKYARQYGWIQINEGNRKGLFMDMIRQMDMSYSYKPVLLKALLHCGDENGRARLEDVVSYFKAFYENRRAQGLSVEKKNSLFARGGYTDKEVERNILSNPFKRFQDRQMLHHAKALGIIQIEETVWQNLTDQELIEIKCICDEKLTAYFARLT